MKKLYFTITIALLAITLNAQVDRSITPQPGPAPEINLNDPERFELPNGLKVLVVENHKLPRVSIQLTIDNPPVAEGDKAGVSILTGSLLGNGSKTISKDDFNEEVDFLGARINFGFQSAFASSLSKYFPRILELMADAAINPNFTQEEFDKEKAKLITALKSEEKDVSAIASRVQNALAYGVNHPNGEFATEETVNNVTMADIERFYRELFVPANAYLVVIGDVKFDVVKELVSKNFDEWVKASPPSLGYSDPLDVQYTQINFVDVPNAVQSEVTVENLVDLKMKDEDYLAAKITNFILGGASVSRLEQNLREDKAFTYYSRSRLGDNKYGAATFKAFTSVRNIVTDSAIVELLGEIDKIITDPISEEELEIAKSVYVGSFVLALEKPSTIARYALNIETEGLPPDFYKTYLERINAITVEDVQKAAQKYFQIKNARIVVAGKGSDVIESLEKIPFNGRMLPVNYYDKYAKAVEKPKYDNVLPEGVNVQSVLDAYFEAIGGKTAVNKIQSLKLVYEGSAMGSSIKTEEKRTADKYVQTTFMNDAPMMGVIAKGDELFMKQGGNKVPLPPEMQQDMKSTIGIFPEQGIALSNKAKLTGTEDIDGKAAYKIEVPGSTVQATYFYDVESGLKVKEASVITMNGQTQNQEVNYKDYQEVDGIKFPSVRVGSMGPQMIETKLLEAVINVEVSEEDFN
jgi:predicted Zn-dependent peptidase